MKSVYLYILFCLCFSYSYSQYTVSMINVRYSNGTPIPSGQPINFNSSGTVSFTFDAKVTTDVNLVDSDAFGNVEVYAKRTNKIEPDWLQTVGITLGPTNSSPKFHGVTGVGKIILNASDFNFSGDYIYVVYKPLNIGGSGTSVGWPIDKTSVSGNPILNNVISANQSLPVGGIPEPIIGSTPTGGSGVFTYIWKQYFVPNGPQSVIPGATSKDYNPGPITQNTFFVREVSSPGSSNSVSTSVYIQFPPCKIGNYHEFNEMTTYTTPYFSQQSGFLRLQSFIYSGVKTTYQAGEYIVMETGFYGAGGSQLHAYIAGCGDSSAMMMANTENVEAEKKEEIFVLYPNPAIDNVSITSNKLMSSVLVASLSGLTFFQSEIKATSYELNIGNYPKGIYVVTVTTSDGKTEFKKLIKN
ncbi:T9SS type A sorting domain-containing protein [Flavobacterium cerinum]|uniref:T9SS type A sorting domain-containing protein n=2 Tax=Flavobacterium cerinum TaxID=2502784 RepID=A0A444GMA6_9FLAO|nr:T9SS type A sorting domain-containing protein [Flavobacterium cerinum]